MSTKLYNAYKLPKMNLDDFFTLVEKIKKNIGEIQDETYVKEFSEKALRIYDFKTLYPNGNIVLNYGNYQSDESEMTISSIVHKMMDISQKKHKLQDKMNSFYFHVHFLFHNDIIYAITRHLNDKMEKVFVELTKGQSYEYYNNTDCPEDVTKEEWGLREKEWNEVFGSTSWDIPNAKNSIKLQCEFELFHHRYQYNYPDNKSILNTSRTNYFATDEVVREHFEHKTYTEHDVFRFLSSNEFRDKVKLKNEEIFQKLEHNQHAILLDKSLKIFKNRIESNEACLDLNIELDLI